MPLNLRIPLPGPFSYTHRFGGRSRGPTINGLAQQTKQMQAQHASLRHTVATATAIPMRWWWMLVVIAALTFVSPYTAIFGVLLIFPLWVRSPWWVARRDRRNSAG